VGAPHTGGKNQGAPVGGFGGKRGRFATEVGSGAQTETYLVCAPQRSDARSLHAGKRCGPAALDDFLGVTGICQLPAAAIAKIREFFGKPEAALRLDRIPAAQDKRAAQRKMVATMETAVATHSEQAKLAAAALVAGLLVLLQLLDLRLRLRRVRIGRTLILHCAR